MVDLMIQDFQENQTMSCKIKEGIYKHYKGNHYRVFGVVNHSETLEKMVHYQALYGEEKHWVRPYDMFFEEIKVENTGEKIPRFEYLTP